jgi:teichuronic acid biosynthesis glycosyltransferase TuaC
VKVLIVCSGTTTNKSFKKMKPFVYEQIKELEKLNIEFDVFLIEKKGVIGYLKSRKALMQTIKSTQFDIIHAHYGLSGMLAVLQFKVPVVISFIGSDINNFKGRLVLKLAMILSAHNIFVNKHLQIKAKIKKKYSIVPYGINFSETFPIEKSIAREIMKIPKDEIICLFGSSRNRMVKNFPLAEKAVRLCKNVKLYDLHGNYDKNEVINLINASDCVLLTSFNEGSPQIIKEALACNVPIVTTDVGDVRSVIGDTIGCYICSYEAEDVATKINEALTFGIRTNGRKNIQHLDNVKIAERVALIYQSIS